MSGVKARWVQVRPDPVEGLAGVARREAPELEVDAEARADLNPSVADPGVEPIERPRGRPADPDPEEVVDPAMARADEPLGSRDVPDRASAGLDSPIARTRTCSS